MRDMVLISHFLPKGRPHWRHIVAAVYLSSNAVCMAAATAASPRFSPGFLVGDAADALGHFESSAVKPGIYVLDVVVNGQFLRQESITFVAESPDSAAIPCVSAALLRGMGVKAKFLQDLPEDVQCVDLPRWIDGASVQYDEAELRLVISIPQAAMASLPGGHVPLASREQGITAGFIDYQLQHRGVQSESVLSIGTRMGFNIGAWRLRHDGWFTHAAGGLRWRDGRTSLQRDLPNSGTRLQVGQEFTPGYLFDSVAYTGIRVASDRRMLADSLEGYAPVVKGVAQGTATVSIRQNGRLIRELVVPPGPFIIEDLVAGGGAGDLDVSVTEAGGQTHSFRVPFSAVPQALRPGVQEFSVVAGRLDPHSSIGTLPTEFIEATFGRGLDNRLTMLSGVQLSSRQKTFLIGTAFNTALGAIGLDARDTHVRRRGGVERGQSYRVNYQRLFPGPGTGVGVTAWHSSGAASRGLIDLWPGPLSPSTARPAPERHEAGLQRLQVNLSQRLADHSSLFVSYGREAARTDLQAGFSGRIGSVNYSLTALRYHHGEGEVDTRCSFFISMPLGTPASRHHVSGHFSPGPNARSQIRLSGASGARNELNYDASAGSIGSSRLLDTHASYQGGQGSFSAGYGREGRRETWQVSAAGSIVLHADGLTFGQTLGDTVVLVQAVGATGAHVRSGHELRIGRNGYAVMPSASPYRWNQIELDPAGLPLDVQLLQTSQRVAPTAGSIVRVPFHVRRQRTLFIDAVDAQGQPLPFAASVQDESGRSIGVVGQGSVIRLQGAAESGALIVDAQGARRCRLEYQLPQAADVYGLSWSQGTCVPELPDTATR